MSKLIKKLIDTFEGKFSSLLGIELSEADSGQIFRWFLASKLFGARISSNIAISTYREFEKNKVTSPEKILETGWDGLVQILDDGGYVRYDFSTATRLLSIMENLNKYYNNDLNRLHKRARDEEDLENLLKALGKGIGDVTVNIFLRELRTVWPKARPKLSPLVKLAAERLGLIEPGADPLKALEKIWSSKKIQGKDFCDFEAALLRLGKDFCKKSKTVTARCNTARCSTARCSTCPMKKECKWE